MKKWDDGEALPRSTLQSAVQALVEEVDITTTLTCPVKEFLGPEPLVLGPRQRERREGGGGRWLGMPTHQEYGDTSHLCVVG